MDGILRTDGIDAILMNSIHHRIERLPGRVVLILLLL